MKNAIATVAKSFVTKNLMKVAEYNRRRMKEPEGLNLYTTGLNTPMRRELTVEALPVTGSIPDSLNGLYVRNGPNPIEPTSAASHHWFMGEGMVHGLRIINGRAEWYRNRWVRSSKVSQVLGEREVPGPRQLNDIVNTNVISHAGKLWALVEAGGNPVELAKNLDSIKHNDFHGTLKGSFTAHPRKDVLTGKLHAICYESTDANVIRHVVVDANGKVEREEPIAVRHGPSIHDCLITKNFVIVLDLPVTFSMKALLAGYSFPYVWNPDHEARVGVLEKDAPGSEIVWCKVDPSYVFHVCNGYESDDGNIVMDVVGYSSMFQRSRTGPSPEVRGFERWTIDYRNKQVKRKVIDTSPQEFPRFDERLTGFPYRYGYCIGLEPEKDGGPVRGADYLVRHDLVSGTREIHNLGENYHAGEFVFVPKHKAARENEGWLMGLAVNEKSKTTDFLIIDTEDFTGSPQARIHLAHQVPAGFHGNWVPIEEISS